MSTRATTIKELQRRDRLKVLTLREGVREAKSKRTAQRQRVVSACQLARQRNRELAKAERQAMREKINAEIEKRKLEAREQCATRKGKAQAQAGRKVSAAEKSLGGERARQRAERERVEMARRTKRGPRAMTRTERGAESDSFVEHDLPDELVPIWRRVKKQIKATPKATRAEVFVQWVHDHSAEVARIRDEEVQRSVDALVAQQEKMLAQEYGRMTDIELAREHGSYQGTMDVPF